MGKLANRHGKRFSRQNINWPVEKLCYLGDTIGARRGAFDSAITKIRSGWCKFIGLVPLSASRCLPLGAKGRLYTRHYAIWK